MRRYALFLLLLVVLPAGAFAQSANWQQHVRYQMDIHLLADRHRMRGHQRLVYYNNSPDTLYKVYYHLYFNAFQPQSMMADRNRHLPDPDSRVVPRIFNLGPDEIGWHRIEYLKQEGTPLSFEVFDTVLEAQLAHPIPPGDSTVFTMAFHSQIPLQTRRSGRDNLEGIDYSMSQWYPKIAQYDEHGWHPDPYVNREFYAPFGSFDVRITLPSEYIIGATGQLQNPEEVGYGYGQTDSSEPASTADSLTWHFVAHNVHDFAWAADPDYIHDSFTGPDGTRFHLLYQPGVADRWQMMHEWVPAMFAFLNEEYGPYPYPQFTIAQAGDGGMEYPQIIFLTGRRSPSSLKAVTAHEIGHEWFYAVLATNEADFAWMDEGFTSYAETEVLHHLSGAPGPANHLSSYLNVIYAQQLGLFEALNTPADWFQTNLGYGIASYPGGEMLIDMLGGVISDSLRDRWLKRYYEKYAFRHPQPEDIERLAERISGLRLDWFFEQWTDMTRELDYALAELTSAPTDGAYHTTIVVKRKEPVVMPVDVRLTLADGSTQWVNIPLSIMQGHKPVPDDWIVARPWGWTDPTYTLEITTPERAVKAEVDPLVQMPDQNRLNNSNRLPVEFSFLEPPVQGYLTYRLGWRPSLHFARNFGPGVGLQFYGLHFYNNHRLRATLKVWPVVLNTSGEQPELDFPADNLSPIDGINYEFSYRRRLEALEPLAWAEIDLRNQLGIVENRIAVSKQIGEFAPLPETDTHVSVALYHQNRYSERFFSREKISWPEEHFLWARLSYRVAGENDRLEITADLGGTLQPGDSDRYTIYGNASYLGRRYLEYDSAVRFTLQAQESTALGPFTGQARLGLGWGTKDLALQKRFHLSSAALAQRWRSDAFRSVAAAMHPENEAHLVAFPHAGPVAYTLSETHFRTDPVTGEVTPSYRPLIHSGRQKMAATISLQTAPFEANPWLSPLSLELFAGVGTVWDEAPGDIVDIISEQLGDLKADAGIGISYDVNDLQPLQRWTSQSSVLRGLNITAKFPLWVSHPELIDPDESAVGFRWLVGVQL